MRNRKTTLTIASEAISAEARQAAAGSRARNIGAERVWRAAAVVGRAEINRCAQKARLKHEFRHKQRTLAEDCAVSSVASWTRGAQPTARRVGAVHDRIAAAILRQTLVDICRKRSKGKFQIKIRQASSDQCRMKQSQRVDNRVGSRSRTNRACCGSRQSNHSCCLKQVIRDLSWNSEFLTRCWSCTR